MDQTSSYNNTFESLKLFDELKSTVDSLKSKKGGLSEREAKSLDVIISGSMSPKIFESMTYNDFRGVWNVQFDYKTLKKRLARKINFLEGELGALIDDQKWHNSGNWWDDDAIELFRDFYRIPSPAVYLDHTGRKVSFTNFEGKKEYDFLYGLNPKSTKIDVIYFVDVFFFLFEVNKI